MRGYAFVTLKLGWQNGGNRSILKQTTVDNSVSDKIEQKK